MQGNCFLGKTNLPDVRLGNQRHYSNNNQHICSLLNFLVPWAPQEPRITILCSRYMYWDACRGNWKGAGRVSGKAAVPWTMNPMRRRSPMDPAEVHGVHGVHGARRVYGVRWAPLINKTMIAKHTY